MPDAHPVSSSRGGYCVKLGLGLASSPREQRPRWRRESLAGQSSQERWIKKEAASHDEPTWGPGYGGAQIRCTSKLSSYVNQDILLFCSFFAGWLSSCCLKLQKPKLKYYISSPWLLTQAALYKIFMNLWLPWVAKRVNSRF